MSENEQRYPVAPDSAAGRQLRQNVRNFLYPMTKWEMERELEISVEQGDHLRAKFVRECIKEWSGENG